MSGASCGKKMFITVGTTEFDQLISVIDCAEFRSLIISGGFHQLVIQIGRGVYQPTFLSGKHGLECRTEVYRFKPTLDDDMCSADLIISHCGAGSILEAVKYEKDLIVVVNDTLQGNHQTELADAMSEAGYCTSTLPADIMKVLADRFAEEQFPLRRRTRMSSIPITDPSHFSKVVGDMYEFSS